MAARTGGDVLRMVFWYNSTPREGMEKNTIPSHGMFAREWRIPISTTSEVTEGHRRPGSSLAIGDAVYVKPPAARCTKEWPRGVVTKMPSGVTVEVNGIPRHIADVRAVPEEQEPPAVAREQMSGEEIVGERPHWERKMLQRLDDYVL
jgi:hypothetical protein